MMYCHALLISLKQMYVISFLTLLFFVLQYIILVKMDFIIIYSSLAQMSLYHFLFSLYKRERERERKNITRRLISSSLHTSNERVAAFD